jgi:hypothetical protein
MWLISEYLPELGQLDLEIFPSRRRVARWLGGRTRDEAVPIPRETPGWMLGSFRAHPERVLDPRARGATSGLARMPRAVVSRVVNTLQRDQRSGAWDRQRGHLHDIYAYDVGLRLVVGHRD